MLHRSFVHFRSPNHTYRLVDVFCRENLLLFVILADAENFVDDLSKMQSPVASSGNRKVTDDLPYVRLSNNRTSV